MGGFFVKGKENMKMRGECGRVWKELYKGVRDGYNNALHTSIMYSKIKLKCVLLKSGHGGTLVVPALGRWNQVTPWSSLASHIAYLVSFGPKRGLVSEIVDGS